MKKICLMVLLLNLLAWPVFLPGQSRKSLEKAGDRAFSEKDYYTAFVHYSDAMAIDPTDATLWYKYADVSRHFNAYEQAEKYYELILENDEDVNFPLAVYWLAQIEKLQGNYDEATGLFEHYLNIGNDEYYQERARNELEICEWAKNVEPPDNQIVTVTHLDRKINSSYSEFGALEVGDELYYSSYRYRFKSDDHVPERRLTKVLSAEEGERGRPLRRGFNYSDKHTAHITFSSDRQRVYFTVCKYVNASEIRCEIHYREKDHRGNWERKSTRLPEIVNMPGYTATQPSVGLDSISGKEILFFASDRPNGRGKMDIWYTLLDSNTFLLPVNLSAVNTPEDDITPFFHVPGQTLYFSSTGHPGLGGYDIFYIEKNAEWGEVENAGKPENSSYHDIYFSLGNSRDTGYLSSNRPGSFYLDRSNKACCHDIYQVTYADLPADQALTDSLTAAEIHVDPPPVNTTPQTLEDFLPLALYFDNDEPDKRTRRTFTKKTYIETYDRYIDRRKEYIERFTKPLDEEAADEAALYLEDFFENEVLKGFQHLNLFSEILLNRLKKEDRVEIVIKGYTSPRAKSEYNERLAQRRISSLRNHFDEWRDGVFQNYLDRGLLVITEAPFGETKAARDVSDDLVDERNSIYSVGASRERRVEIVEIK